ncbi:MAG: HEPN domain-containing protein [Anaerolineales bacterium]|nr:HEPN domain-containing protein [Anaerolineales bacterium]
MSKNKLLPALNEISKFINSLDIVEGISREAEYDLFFSLADEGTLLLSGKEAIQYRQCLKLLIDTIGDESISPKTIETLYQKTILTALDIHEKRRDKPFEQRLKVAIDELQNSLTTTPTTFSVYYPVFGLALDGLPIQVGNVLFCKFDDVHLEKFLKFLNEYEGDESEKAKRMSFADSIKQSEIFGKSAGLIDVKAFDNIAAKTLALKELALTVDVINFFSDIIPYQKGHIYLPGNNERLTINIPIISKGEKPNFTFGWEVAGPLMPFSFPQLLENDKKRDWGFSKIANLLAKKRNGLEDKIISAIQWAGKATVEGKKEEAFLLYAISLESLVLLDNEKEELGYRLRTRVAHLLGGDLESRMKISNKVRDLYTVRSKIVHSGSYQVTDADISLIRLYSKNCILHIVNNEPFSSMNSIDSLVQWFNEKILT